MKHLLTATLSLTLVLVSVPASAFLDIDSLENKLNTIDDSSTSSSDPVDDLLNEIAAEVEPSAPSSFTDVNQNDWFHIYVMSVAEWGIVSGYKDANGNFTGQYGPGDPVTVAQMLKIAVEAAKIDTSSCGSSVSTAGASGHWAERYVACTEDRNARILNGSADINAPAKRGEVLGIIFDIFGTNTSSGGDPFLDTVGHAYQQDIAYASTAGIVSGDTTTDGQPTGMYRPNDPVNRAEAAKIIYAQLRSAE